MLDRLQVAIDYAIENSPIDRINNSLKKVTKVAGATGLALAGMAVKTGLSEAMDLEGFRLTLETVTKDVTKAKELMQWGSEFANATPFENKEIVEGITKLTSYGMTAKDVLPKVGDMASVMGKSLDQAVEAIADAQTGSMERMKEFGVTKDMIIQQAKDMRMGLIVNNKGQITDQAKFNEAMFALMDSKFKGGMEKQATTMKGLWSTVTGTTKNALAEIVGITADGTIKQGSLFENVKIAITGIITKLNEWSADGTFQAIATKATDIIGGIITAFSTLSTFISQNKELIILITGALGLYVAALEVSLGIQAVVNGYKKIELAYTTAQTLANGNLTFSQWALNAAMSANPIGMVVLGLTAIVGALVLAYKHSETFRNIIDGLWTKLKDFGGKVVEVFDKVKNFIGLGKDTNINATTTTKTATTKPLGSHRTGESFVKNDGMYKLHYGERVLTKAENEQGGQGGVSQSPSINISINAVQELGNEIKRAIQPIVETTIKNYQTKQLMKMGIAGGQ